MHTFPPFEVHAESSSVGLRWKIWLVRFERFLVVADITDDPVKRAALLHYAGDSVCDIFDTLSDTGTNDDYSNAVAALDKYFTPLVNANHAIFVFRQAFQNEDETIDDYCTRLRILAVDCSFSDLDSELKAHIIQTCRSFSLRRRALRDSKLTLTDLLDLARALSLADTQAASMEKRIQPLHLHQPPPSQAQSSVHRLQASRNSSRDQMKPATCYNCGNAYPHDGDCPAKNRNCNHCGIRGHYGKMCKKKAAGGTKDGRNYPLKQGSPRRQSKSSPAPNRGGKKNGQRGKVDTNSSSVRTTTSTSAVTPDDSDSDTSIFTVSALSGTRPKAVITINGTDISFLIDSGADINLMPKASFLQILPKPRLDKTSKSVFAYGSDVPLMLDGVFQATLTFNKNSLNADVYVMNSKHGEPLPVLSYHACSELKLLQTIHTIHADQDTFQETVIQKYPNLFRGIGKMKNFQVKLHIDPSVKPVAQRHRRIPLHLRKPLEEELQSLIDQDVIEQASGPTPWVSPPVLVPRPHSDTPGAIRLCIDMRCPNTAISRERHVTPLFEDIFLKLSGAKYFSKIDLKNGYHQLELHPDSRAITTFSTHKGLFRYKRLNFGVCSAAEIFQNVIAQVISDIECAENVSDDIIVFGKNREEHDGALHQLLYRLQEHGFTLNKKKCLLAKTSVIFFGHTFGQDGCSPVETKVKAIRDASRPNCPKDVRSFLGMLNYCSRYIPNLTTIVEPLRVLTRKKTQFRWTSLEETAFNQRA